MVYEQRKRVRRHPNVGKCFNRRCGAAPPLRVIAPRVAPRDPQLLGLGELEPVGHHAEDGCRLAVDLDRLPHHIRVAPVAGLPRVVAEHHRERRAGPIVTLAEGRSQDGRDPQDVEHTGSHRQRIAGKSPGLVHRTQGSYLLHNVLAPAVGSHRQSSADDFA